MAHRIRALFFNKLLRVGLGKCILFMDYLLLFIWSSTCTMETFSRSQSENEQILTVG